MYIKKNDQQKIKTIFYTNAQIIKEYWFNITSRIKDIFNYFEKHIKEEGYLLKPTYKIFGKKINQLYSISELIKQDKNDIILEGEIWIEVEEDTYFDDENDEMFYTLLQPKINPFELIEYNPIKKKIKLIECPPDIINYCHLDRFSKESAFCNSYNSLYISGGEVSGKAINNFWIIDKNSYKISKKYLPVFKKYHSMLYIPDNFIFITGGDSLSTVIYDIDNKEFIKWANMNKKHFQPGLFIYGDYIYAFSALTDKNNNNNFFEKTNLTSKNSKWEIIYPKFDNNNIRFNCHFFGLSKLSEGNILFVGGEKNNPNYLYNPEDNMLSISNGESSSVPFWDKTFYKISKYYNVGIPLNFTINYQLCFIDKETESLLNVECNKNNGTVNLNLEKGSKEGNMYIHSIIKNLKTNQTITIQTGISPKNIMKKNNNSNINNYKYKNDIKDDFNNNKDNEDINFDSENVIINACYDNLNNMNYPSEKKLNRNNKKNYLYISDYYVDDQIINREVDTNHDNFEENENIIFDKNEDEENGEKKNYYCEDDIFKEECILIDDLNANNENGINIPYVRENKKQFLYISNSVLNDQLIKRELISNNNENDNKINSENKPKNQISQENTENKTINIDETIPEIKIEIGNDEVDENNEGDEGEKININYGDEYSDEIDVYKIKPTKDNKFLYISYSTIDDQIINRQVVPSENDIKNTKGLTIRENSKPYLKKRIEQNKSNKSTIQRDSKVKSCPNLDNEIEASNYINNEEERKTLQYKNERKIYLPENVVEDQIIQRIVSDEKKII